MSLENLKQFGRTVATDPEVRAQVKAIGRANVEGIIDYAASRGLPFDAEDLRALARESGFDEAELSEDQLRSVAGGQSGGPLGQTLGGASIGGGVLAAGVLAGQGQGEASPNDW